MTAIKQKAVISNAHGKNLRRYIDHKDALLRDSQNLINPQKWFQEMDATREDHGHNKSRASSRNTIIYHQMLNFLPDECDVNNGRLSPNLCMEYAKEYALTYYPDYQIAFALHKEHCKPDNTDRYSVHMAINRTNLATGNRLDEGRGSIAKKKRANQVRAIDEKWELTQLKKGERNSFVHNKQPSRIEREIEARSDFSYKSNLRKLMDLAKDETADLETWIIKLFEWGVAVSIIDDMLYVTDLDNNKYFFRTDMLNYDFTLPQLESDLSDPIHKKSAKIIQFKRKMGSESLSEQNIKIKQDEYKHDLEKAFKDYKKTAIFSNGIDYNKFPVFKPPKIPDIYNSFELNLLTVSLKDQADDLRMKYSTNTPFLKKNDTVSNNIPGDMNISAIKNRNHSQTDPHKKR